MPIESSSASDRRAEQRHTAYGPVWLRVQSSARVPALGQLLDITKSGFRARHRLRRLRPGQEVEFEVAGFPGLARVVWTRILGGQAESGFQIVAANSE